MKFSKFKFLYAASVILALSFVSCEKDESKDSTMAANYVGLEAAKFISIPENTTATFEGKVYASSVSNVDRTYALVPYFSTNPSAVSTTIDPSLFTLPATVTIPAGQIVGTYQVTATATDLGPNGKRLVVGLEQVSGTDINLTSYTAPTPLTIGAYPTVTAVVSNRTVFTIENQCDLNRLKISITFDRYPEETGWELYDADMNLIGSGGMDDSGNIIGYDVDPESTIKTKFCLPSGSYSFFIYDVYGDGMYTDSNSNGQEDSEDIYGKYVVRIGEAVIFKGGGNFGAIAQHDFVIP